MEHVLIASGVPGIGKTALALLTAAELGTQLKVVSSKMNVNEARIVLAGMNDVHRRDSPAGAGRQGGR
jgi:Holliday junction resolvasome RuvABC ATP-dependent DNA helicase subunit